MVVGKSYRLRAVVSSGDTSPKPEYKMECVVHGNAHGGAGRHDGAHLDGDSSPAHGSEDGEAGDDIGNHCHETRSDGHPQPGSPDLFHFLCLELPQRHPNEKNYHGDGDQGKGDGKTVEEVVDHLPLGLLDEGYTATNEC